MRDCGMEKKGLELGVGVFLLVGLACLGYLSFKLGKVQLFGSSDYKVYATFTTTGGLKEQAPVTEAGVGIGHVGDIRLKDGMAKVTLWIHKNVRLEDDVIASIKTTGIIGDKYVAIVPGASETVIKPDGIIRDTQPPLDLESLLGKFVFGSVEKPGEKSGEKPSELK
jgi:phospholipid/cholesterol/gamma-HCH transport system substrate-binding protein